MTTTRLSIDMSRRVPMGATRVDTEVVRDGKRIQAIEAAMWSTTRSSAEPQRCGFASPRTCRAQPGASRRPDPKRPGHPSGYHVDLRRAARFRRQFRLSPKRGRRRSGDRLDEDGEAVRGGRVERSTVLIGRRRHDPERWQRARLRADDLDQCRSGHLAASATGREWLGFTAAVRGEGNGYGQADATLFDHRGRIGRALKSLLVDTR